jgi:hypothetical protein
MICILSWVAVVIWWPAVAVLPRRPSQLAVCRKCGYSLIGNVSGVCPECGTPCVVVPEVLAAPVPIPPRGAHLGPLFRLAVALTVAAALTHLAFVVRYLSAVLRPSNSPYGHENAFGDAPQFMSAWALIAPAALCAAAALLAGCAVVRGWSRGATGGGTPLALWVTHLAIVHYLVVIYFTWFFD